MAANTLDVIRDRVTSVLARSPFIFTPAVTPFDFEQQPSGLIDKVYRVEAESGRVIGGMSYSETRQDVVRIWVSRSCSANPEVTYRALTTDAGSIVAAVVRDGAELGGDYDVLDSGRSAQIIHGKGQQFAVLRLTLQADYEAQL